MVESTNNQEISLIAFDFGQMNIKVYGTDEVPLFKCSDILIHVLEYRYSADAKWFRNIDDDLKQMYIVDHGQKTCFNEQGLYWALMKSNKPIAKQFQVVVCNMLQNMRINTKKQIALQTQQLLLQKDQQTQQLLQQKDEQLKQQQQKNEEELKRQQDINQCKLDLLSDIGPIKEEDKKEHIYIWSCKSFVMKNLYKIGKTEIAVDKRLQSSGSSLPEDIILLKKIKCYSSTNLEQRIHNLLFQFRFRKNREFFKISYTYLLRFIQVIEDSENDVIEKFNQILSEYQQMVNQGELITEQHPDIKAILNDVDYIKDFFNYLRTKGLNQIEQRELEQYLDSYKTDRQPTIPQGFKHQIKDKFKSNEGVQIGQMLVQRIVKPRITYTITYSQQ